MKTQFVSKKIIMAILVCLVVMMFGTSCARISEEQKETANRMIENLFAGIVLDDYAMFSKDFDAPMLEAMDETGFQELRLTFNEEIGTDYEIQWDSAQNSKVKGNTLGVHHFKITSSSASAPIDFTLYATADGTRTYVSGFSMDSGDES